jgi:hypothetical protein
MLNNVSFVKGKLSVWIVIDIVAYNAVGVSLTNSLPSSFLNTYLRSLCNPTISYTYASSSNSTTLMTFFDCTSASLTPFSYAIISSNNYTAGACELEVYAAGNTIHVFVNSCLTIYHLFYISSSTLDNHKISCKNTCLWAKLVFYSRMY